MVFGRLGGGRTRKGNHYEYLEFLKIVARARNTKNRGRLTRILPVPSNIVVMRLL
jgi:hypothetical protein